MKIKKFGFSLAEVLITLGIVGVIAAIAIPILVADYQKKLTALEVKKAYTELNQILRMAMADHGDPNGWNYTKADELPLWVKTYFEPYVKVTGAKSCTTNESCLGLPLPYPLKTAKPGSFNTMVAQYAVAKMGTPIGYGFSRYPGNYEPVTRVRVYIRNSGKRLAWQKKPYGIVGKDVFTFILTKADNEPMFKPYGWGTLGSYGISTKDRNTLLGTGWGGCNQKASGSGYWTPGDACAAVIMVDGWKISKDYPW